ncbi:Pectate lyase L [Fusarium agapanthi]|uniref:Pectate lyase L n=1 Tax=Fusarium agapanthi TaxID=1803897 RepID=A0A9P5BHP3_9HYPO|nr:Pectate lyase L [Fusarium agapanthi]
MGITTDSLAKDIFVAPNGSSSGSDSSSSPLADIQAAVSAASAGDTIYLRKGTYRPSKKIQFNKKGSSSKPYTIRSYNNEEVIIDGDKMPGTPAASAPASLAKIARLTTHSNYETGFHMQNSISNNEIIYLDTYNNADPRNNGQNADGMAIKEGSDAGNIIRGIRSYESADDGIDLYDFKSSITILGNIIFDNGVNRWNFNPYRGDGIGIKLGGGSPANRVNVNHVARNNVSFRNRRGFSDNNMLGDMTLIHNTTWKNREEGFNQRSSKATYENNLAAIMPAPGKGNNWEKGGSWQDADFKATSTSLIKGRRQANGKITRSDFLRPANGGNYGATTHWV